MLGHFLGLRTQRVKTGPYYSRLHCPSVCHQAVSHEPWQLDSWNFHRWRISVAAITIIYHILLYDNTLLRWYGTLQARVRLALSWFIFSWYYPVSRCKYIIKIYIININPSFLELPKLNQWMLSLQSLHLILLWKLTFRQVNGRI